MNFLTYFLWSSYLIVYPYITVHYVSRVSVSVQQYIIGLSVRYLGYQASVTHFIMNAFCLHV